MILSKRYKIPFALFLIVFFFYLVLANAPAGWAAWAVTKAVPGFWMSSPSGSLWRGEASSAQLQIASNQPPLGLGKVNWQLSPLSLLMLSPCLKITTSLPGQNISGKFCHGLSGTTKVQDLNLDAPVATINEYTPLPLNGDMSVQIMDAKIASDGQIRDLEARFSWQRARAFFDGTWLELGSLAGTAKENGKGGALAELFDLEGPFKVALNGELNDFKKGWEIQGTVTPQQNASQMIVQGLQILGEDLGNGSYKVQWP